MKDKYKYNKSQLLNFTEDSYLERTSRPIYAIVFLLPFIIFYELGTILINTDVLNQTQVRVVAFVWLQNLLEYLGLGSKLAWCAPALAVVIILTGLQFASRKQWRFYAADIWPMATECILLAVPLIVFSLFLNSSGQQQAAQITKGTIQIQTVLPLNNPSVTTQSHCLLANIVTGIGAGIYEELVFRLILICVLMMLFQDVLRFGNKSSIVLSVLVSAALFSAHHHIIFLDGQLATSAPFSWLEFGFRTTAGVYFAVVFAIRGFGIAAGTHAFYDIIATIINTVFFQQ